MLGFPRAAFAAACLGAFLSPAAARADDPPAPVRLGGSCLRHYCSDLAWAPDGKTFASAGVPGTIRVWDAADGKELHQFKADDDLYTSVRFDREGKRLLAGGVTGTVHVLDATTGAEVRALRSGPQQIKGLAWRADGKVATLAQGYIFRIWDPNTGKTERQSGGPAKPPAFDYEVLSADGERYAVWVKDKEADVLTVWDADGKELFHAPTGLPSVDEIAFTADGKTLAVFGAPPGGVALWDVDAGKEVRRFDGVYPADRTLVFSPNGKYFAGRSGDGAVHVWGVASGKDLRQLDMPLGTGFIASGKALAFSPDGKKLIGAQGSQIHLWDLETGAEVPGFVGHNGSVQSICFSADGRTVVTCGWDFAAGRWDAATGKRLTWRTWADVGAVPLLAVDGESVLLWRQGAIYRCDADQDKPGEHPLLSREWPDNVPDLSRSADGKTLATVGTDHFVHIWDADSGEERTKIKLEPPYVRVFVLSADGRYVATGTAGAGPRLWDAATGTEVRAFPVTPATPGAPVRQTAPLAFSGDGRTLLSGNGFELTWWEVATGRERGRMRMPSDANGPLAFSPDGALLVEGNPAGPTLLDAADGRLLAKLPGDLGRARCLAFTADGKKLAAGGEDGTALVWDVMEYAKRSPAAELSAERLDALWDDLQDEDAARAYRAVLACAASPKSAAPFLKGRVAAAKEPDSRRLARLITDLDDDDFDVRENAQKELEKLGVAALLAVRKALDADPSAESRRRLQQVLDKHKGVVSEEVRCLRAVEALERGGSPEAVEALRALAKDPPTALVRQEAEAALDRLDRRKEKT